MACFYDKLNLNDTINYIGIQMGNSIPGLYEKLTHKAVFGCLHLEGDDIDDIKYDLLHNNDNSLRLAIATNAKTDKQFVFNLNHTTVRLNDDTIADGAKSIKIYVENLQTPAVGIDGTYFELSIQSLSEDLHVMAENKLPLEIKIIDVVEIADAQPPLTDIIMNLKQGSTSKKIPHLISAQLRDPQPNLLLH